MKIILVILALALGMTREAQSVDLVFLNGRILTMDDARPQAEALAVQGEYVQALGSNADMRALAGPKTQIVDLQGRMMVPGLIDSHIHAIRAGLTYSTEVSWSQAQTIEEALAAVRKAAHELQEGGWIIVAGGWTPLQFRQGRRPSHDELESAAPNHRLYVQELYQSLWLSPLARDTLLGEASEIVGALGIAEDGWLSGNARSISNLYDLLPRPSLAQSLEGTRAFFRKLNAYGVTGIIDPGGYNMPLAAYEPVRHLARQNELSLRIAFFICAPQAGFERRDFETFLETGFANENTDRFRFLGFGENVVWGMYNNDKPAAADISRLIDVLDWAAQKKLSLTFHWNNAYSVHHLLGAIETIAPRHDLSSLRWSIAHLHDADLPTLQRMKKLELGWLAQNALWWRGSPFLQQRGKDANPALASALRIGLPTGAGTDAHRVMDVNPFAVMQFMISGRTIDGKILREESESLSRLEALRLYTSGSAWFARQDQQSGMLKPGAFADFAILDKDFLAIPEAEIHTIRAQQTYVGGQKVHEAAR